MIATIRRSARTWLGAALAAAVLSPAGAGRCRAAGPPSPSELAARVRQSLADRWERIRALPGSVRRDDGIQKAEYVQPATTSAPGPTVTPIKWWLVPRRARTAARRFAAAQHKTVTRVVRIEEPDGSARFEVYAAGMVGRERALETVLVTVDDPSAQPRGASEDFPAPAAKP